MTNSLTGTPHTPYLQAVEDLCVQKQGARIYDLLVAELQSNISSRVRSLAQQVGDAKSYLALVDGVWSDHVEQLNTIRNIFLYLDRCVSVIDCQAVCLSLVPFIFVS